MSGDARVATPAERPRIERVDDAALQQEDREGLLRGRRGGRRRRPTGEPPPLPRAQWWSGARWAIVAIAAATASVVVFAYLQPEPMLRADEAVSHWLAERRTPLLVRVAAALDLLSHPVLVGVVRWLTILSLVALRRVRHLLVFVGGLLLVEWAAQAMTVAIQRPRPTVTILAPWDGFSHPSVPVAALAVTVLGALRVLAPPGRIRRVGALGVGVLLAAVGAARVVLGVEHVSDVVVAAALGAGVVFALTRLAVPRSEFEGDYHRGGQHAHITLTPGRIDAIRAAVRDQLGLEVGEINPHGEEGSAGSTPLRLDVTGPDGPEALFAKLYTRRHLRSDRLYKLGRLLLYGRLEDEAPFTTVRQLVQHEDHMSRALRDAGVAVPDTYGMVEITPEQEYLLVFQLLGGEDLDAHEDLSDELIDSCLELVEQLWTAGIAHRDIKPSNIRVDGGRAVLLDVAFAQLRPTPWRQAVDLGAMLLMLSLMAGPRRVYDRALRRFGSEEIAEAVAATDGFVVPSQLRGLLDEDDWSVQATLRELAPPREPLSVHRWDRRRIVAAVLVAAAALVLILGVVAAFDTVGLL